MVSQTIRNDIKSDDDSRNVIWHFGLLPFHLETSTLTPIWQRRGTSTVGLNQDIGSLLHVKLIKY